MTWLLILGEQTLARGSYADVLRAGARRGLIARDFHKDRTEFAPRLDRGVVILPEAMLARSRRAA